MKSSWLCACLAFAALLPTASALAKPPVDYIDPLIGTGRQGKTFPGAATPGGMVQLSPDTITGGDNGSGYRYRDSTIQGFSFTHMSGVGWYGDLGNFLVMPTTGPLHTWYGETNEPGSGYLSRFSHETETAQAGYYGVTLDDYDIRAEATAAAHSGMLRFTFPENPQSRIQIDLARRVGGTSLAQSVQVTDDHTIEGWIDCAPDGGGWGHGAGKVRYRFYFHAEFSRPFERFGVWSADLPTDRDYSDAIETPWFREACRSAHVLPGQRTMVGRHLGFYTEFPTKAGEAVSLKVGISFVSVSGARENLKAEIGGWDFEKARASARQLWAKALDRMEVEGGSEDQKTAFYTAMYHARIDPRIFADVNGDYMGGDGKPHATKRFTKRTLFSGWDVYRSDFPLLTIIAPDTVNDMINSMIELAEQNGTGYFDRWELFNAYTGCMNGSPEVIVINDAYQKGIRSYDVEKAIAFSDATCTRDAGSTSDAFRLSQNMEELNAEWNLFQLASAAGNSDIATKYAMHTEDYRNLFDPSAPWTYTADPNGDGHAGWKGWFRARDAAGNRVPWQGLTSDRTVQEASVYQQGWLVPYDVPGLMDLLGGQETFIAKLSDFFDRTPDVTRWNPYYNHPNEPVHLIPFLFNRAGAPWLTQKWVRKIAETYKTGPDGLSGDEDCGQMSAWFLLAASGLHPACPGDARYEIFTPLFDKVTIRLDPKYARGKAFTITTKNNSPENVYIQSATLNGKPFRRCWLRHEEITAGGTLGLVLGPHPNPQWGTHLNLE